MFLTYAVMKIYSGIACKEQDWKIGIEDIPNKGDYIKMPIKYTH